MSPQLARAVLITIAFAISVVRVCAAQEPATFLHDIKPLLARRCFSCHGPNTHEGGLRLDKLESAVAELDSGQHAIVPGKLDESELIARVTAADESERMPPTGKPLTSTEVDQLKHWIASGAKYEKHWAFVPPQRHAPPDVHNADWTQNPIDAFVLTKL
jgi:hypothetical protein